MKKLRRTFRKTFSAGEKGFTLIELLVVVGILGTLAAVVALNVGGFIGRGECEAYCTEKHNVQTAILADMAEGNSPTLAGAMTYIVGGLNYAWVETDVNGTTGLLSDASDIPSGCSCSGP